MQAIASSNWVPRRISTIIATIDAGSQRLTIYVQMDPPIHLDRCPNIEQVLMGGRDLPLSMTAIEYLPAADAGFRYPEHPDAADTTFPES